MFYNQGLAILAGQAIGNYTKLSPVYNGTFGACATAAGIGLLLTQLRDMRVEYRP